MIFKRRNGLPSIFSNFRLSFDKRTSELEKIMHTYVNLSYLQCTSLDQISSFCYFFCLCPRQQIIVKQCSTAKNHDDVLSPGDSFDSYGKRLSNTPVIESKMIHIVYTNTGGLPGLQMIYNATQVLKFPFVINGNFTHAHAKGTDKY